MDPVDHERLERWVRRSLLLRAALYVRESWRTRKHESPPSVGQLLSDFSQWSRMLRENRNAFDAGEPWLTFAGSAFLKEIAKPQMKVFEFGSGGSTLFLASRVHSGVSIEHDAEWARRVQETLKARGYDNWRVDHVAAELGDVMSPPNPADPKHYAADDVASQNLNYKQYASAIDRVANASLDLVLIDGRARPSCLLHALPKVRSGGWIMLDNAERPHYRYVHETLANAGWLKRTFPGAVPNTFGFSETTFWQRPATK